jgi:hypothetical protein
MKNLTKIVIAFLLVFFIGILFAYKSMFITYNKVNKEQAIVEVKSYKKMVL